jgi:Tol biopolymer transport system component
VGFRGKEFTYRFGGIVGASTGSPVFSSDSKKVAYISTDSTGKYPGKVFIVVNDHAFETYDEIYKNPVFSPDNTKIMYPAQRGHTFYWVVNNVAAIQ